MNGAEALMRTALGAGIDTCFANPGTTEMHLVGALDAVGEIRAVLGLFEGVVTGAADGYGRMTDRPALTITHLGPGFANGIANLHNARRARTPVVNIVGDHATWHVEADAPLTSDIESLARPVSGFVRTVAKPEALPRDAAEAIAAAHRRQVATLIVPQDCTWAEDIEPVPVTLPSPAGPEPDAVEAAAEALRRPGALLFLGGTGMREAGLRAAHRIAAATGCRVVGETFCARTERGRGIPAVERLPYFPEQAVEVLEPTTVAVLAGAPEPVAFFGYRGGRSRLLPAEAERIVLSSPAADTVAALEAVAAALDAPPVAVPDRPAPLAPSGELGVTALGAAVAACQPEGAIVVEEGATSAVAYDPSGAPPHTALGLTGGAIGQGLPCAVGAAVACPDRRVIAFQADGSGMYTVQALWTMAREGLDVTVVVAANRAYRILQFEAHRAGLEPGPATAALCDLSSPAIDWCALAAGMGVPATRPTSADELVDALAASFASDGPRLIEVVI